MIDLEQIKARLARLNGRFSMGRPDYVEDIAALVAEVERLRGICTELRDGLAELQNHPAISHRSTE